MDAGRTIGVAMLGTAALVTVDQIRKGESPRPRDYIGAAAAYMILSVLAEPVPQVAAPMAVLVFVATLFARGPGILRATSSLTGTGKG